MPGVWTHGFYDGWAPNYMIWAGMGYNAIGRFYETFGNSWPITADRVVRNFSDRQWYRPNPPLPQVKWSFRDNINYQESGLLFGLSYMAEHGAHFLERFYEIGERAVAKAANEGPAAYVIPGDQKRQGEVADLLNLLRRHRIEVSLTDAAATIERVWPPKPEEKPAATKSAAGKAQTFISGKDFETKAADESGKGEKKGAVTTAYVIPSGSFVVRMDQPYSRLADTLLDTQYVRGDERVYDDTGWTLGFLKNVTVDRVVNRDVLKVKMHAWNGKMEAGSAVPSGPVAIANVADVDLARLRFAAPSARLEVSDAAFKSGEGKDAREFPAGTVLADVGELGPALAGLHLKLTPLPAMPAVATHPLTAPRIGLIHTWLDTQEEGWWRLGLESLGVPYTYLSTQDVAADPDLRSRFDVLLFPPVGEDPVDIVNGMAPGAPLPWKKSDLTPNLGVIDSTDDMRPGLGLAGVSHLLHFVEQGGLLVTAADTSELAVQYGLARWVTKIDTQKLKAPGTLLLADVTDKKSAVADGYDDTLPVYYSGGPVFRVGIFRHRPPAPRPSGRGGKDDPDVPQGRPFVATPEQPKAAPGEEGFEVPDDAPWFYAPYLPKEEDRPRVVVSFAKGDALFLSGMLEGGDEIAGKPAVIDAPRGQGHILLMSINPMWRANTQGQYALVMNAVMNWEHLSR